jgi:iduronate 2-sulfatase
MFCHLSVVCLICLLLAAVCPAAVQRSSPNVLFIFVDDLRPQLGCYDRAEMHTPNIDRLAETGVRFKWHFVAAPTCGASRYALLTGYRPSGPRDLSNEAFEQMRQREIEGPESMVELFRRNGYRTVGIGKVSHYPDGRVYGYDRPVSDVMEMPRSWDEMGLPYGKWEHGWESFFAYADGSGRTARLNRGEPVPAAEAADVLDTGYPDGLVAQAAVGKLRELKERDEPFFLAVGFFKPHLPFNAPQRYWDLYPEEEADLSPAPGAPRAVHADVALHNSAEAARYTHPDNWREDEAYHRHLRRGYKAAVSYIDSQVGLVLDALEADELAEETIVVLWGDHGFHLGELTIWGKHTLFDWSLHSPLIMRVPGMGNGGAAPKGVVETVDIYPTLADLCGLEAPEDLDGVSLRPALEDPSHEVRTAAFSYWHHGGVSMRTDRYRLTRYRPRDREEPVIELYDLMEDPHETRNIAFDRPDLLERLSGQLDEASPRR